MCAAISSDMCCDREAYDEDGKGMLYEDDCATIVMVMQSSKPPCRTEEKLCTHQRTTRMLAPKIPAVKAAGSMPLYHRIKVAHWRNSFRGMPWDSRKQCSTGSFNELLKQDVPRTKKTSLHRPKSMWIPHVPRVVPPPHNLAEPTQSVGMLHPQ